MKWVKKACNFADALLKYEKQSQSLVPIWKIIENQELSNYTHIVLNWFMINSFVANPRKFQATFLRSTLDHNSITFLVKYKHTKSANEVKHLRKCNDDELTFTKHINNLRNMTSKRLRVLTRIRKSLYQEQTKRSPGAYIMSIFNTVLLHGCFVINLKIIPLAKSANVLSD